MIPHYTEILKKAVLFTVTAFFISCNLGDKGISLEDIEEGEELGSVEIAENVSIDYTDSGIVRARITAKLMKRHPNVEDPYLEMTDGVTADFYNEYGDRQSTLTAGYAVNYESKDLILIRDSVTILNKHDEEIQTSELYWDKKERKIYSDKEVRIREGNEKILYGLGFESNETFTRYRIKNLTGTVYIDEGNNESE